MVLSKAQVIAREETRIGIMQEDAEHYLELLKDGTVEWSSDIDDSPDPYR